MKLTDDDRSEIARLRESTQALKGKLDTTTAYASRKGVLLDGIKLNGAKSEPVVVLLKPKPRSGYGSLGAGRPTAQGRRLRFLQRSMRLIRGRKRLSQICTGQAYNKP